MLGEKNREALSVGIARAKASAIRATIRTKASVI